MNHALKLILILLAPCAFGGWTAEIWPASNTSPRDAVTSTSTGTNATPYTNIISIAKDMWALDCYSALVERASAICVATPAYPSFYRFERANIANYKSWEKLRCSSFFDTSASTNIPPTSFTNLVMWSSSNLLAKNFMPSNFFDYTPWRALNGDIGTTNVYTSRGGTNFPAGRTNWTTADYGWDGVVAVVKALTISVLSVTVSNTDNTYMNGNTGGSCCNPPGDNDCGYDWIVYQHDGGCSGNPAIDYTCGTEEGNIYVADWSIAGSTPAEGLFTYSLSGGWSYERGSDTRTWSLPDPGGCEQTEVQNHQITSQSAEKHIPTDGTMSVAPCSSNVGTAYFYRRVFASGWSASEQVYNGSVIASIEYTDCAASQTTENREIAGVDYGPQTNVAVFISSTALAGIPVTVAYDPALSVDETPYTLYDVSGSASCEWPYGDGTTTLNTSDRIGAGMLRTQSVSVYCSCLVKWTFNYQ